LIFIQCTPDSKYGVWGDSKIDYGVLGTSGDDIGIRGESGAYGVWGSGDFVGVRAYSNYPFESGAGVLTAGPIGIDATGFKANPKDKWSAIGVKASGDIGMQVFGFDAGVMALSTYAVHAVEGSK
jgi:hypothetical protein